MTKSTKKTAKKSAAAKPKAAAEDKLMMEPREYQAAVDKLGRSVRAAAVTFGVGTRQSQRFAAGEIPVPKPVRKLVRLAVKTKTSAEELEDL